MPALCDGTLETRIEGIAGEEGKELRLIGEAGVGAIVVDDGLEASDTTDWFCGPRSERLAYAAIQVGKGSVLNVVDIVVMEKTEIRTPCPLARVGDGQTTSLEDGHLRTVKERESHNLKERREEKSRESERWSGRVSECEWYV